MTIPMNNWCPMCEDACHDHSTICTVCGTSLEAPPSRSTSSAPPSSTSNNNNHSTGNDAFRLVPEFMSQELRQAGRELRDVLSLSRSLANGNGDPTGISNNDNGEWQAIPVELLQNPQPVSSRSEPTSKTYLDRMPRFVLESNSSIFRQATLQVLHENKKISFSLVPGEFGPSENCSLSDCALIVASPRTGKGGQLSEATQEQIIQALEQDKQCIVYLERGDGVSFVDKAMMAQNCGAVAVVIGNSLAEPWPYVMQDSKKDGERLGLSIPVAMAKKEDGKTIVELCTKEDASAISCKFEFQQLSRDCAICTDSLAISQKILQIPACGHIFHEACAMQWLTKHHNCPYCRTLLPTDDRDGNVVMPNRGDSSQDWGRYYG